MNILLEKLSSYNIFNYLFPGIIFVIIAESLTSFSFIQENILIGLFLYYFIGLVISRIGSLVVEPLLKRIKFLIFADYSDFVAASKTDKKIELFSEINNMYRTICSLFLLLIFTRIYEEITILLPLIDKWGMEILTVCLFFLFLFSYRKQTEYIKKCIKNILKKG
jgi:hypothetical protein